MLGETGRQVMGPIRGSGDFLAYGSPSISAVSHILSVLPSIFADNVMIDCRDLEWRLHIVLNEMLQELLHDIQVTNKLLLDMLGLLVVLPSSVF